VYFASSASPPLPLPISAPLPTACPLVGRPLVYHGKAGDDLWRRSCISKCLMATAISGGRTEYIVEMHSQSAHIFWSMSPEGLYFSFGTSMNASTHVTGTTAVEWSGTLATPVYPKYILSPGLKDALGQAGRMTASTGLPDLLSPAVEFQYCRYRVWYSSFRFCKAHISFRVETGTEPRVLPYETSSCGTGTSPTRDRTL